MQYRANSNEFDLPYIALKNPPDGGLIFEIGCGE